MSGRRWGRVTVEGWVEEAALGPAGNLLVFPTREGSSAQAFFNPGSNSELVFLPEPVQFKDGDVIRFELPVGVSAFRVDGSWQCSDDRSCTHDDDYVERALKRGLAVRLVPEANGG